MKKYILSLIFISLIGFLFYKKVYIPKHTFKTITPKIENVTIKVNGIGNISSENSYKISAIYGGKVSDFNLSIGDFVKKGEIIAVIDSVDLKDKIKEIKSNIEVIKATILSLEIDKKSAYKEYLYQEELLKKNQKLYQKRAISELDYKKYLTNTDVAKLKVDSLEKKIVSLKNQILQLKSSLSGVEERLKRYKITSPIAGYVIKKFISNYDVVSNNQPLVEIVSPKEIWIDAFVDTRISSKIKKGQLTFIQLRSGEKLRGYVYKISPINNPITNEREIFIKPNKPILHINEQAVINIKIKTLKNVTTIPAKAVVFYNQKEGVWILKNKKAKFLPLKIIAHSGNKVVIQQQNIKIILPNPKKKPLSEGMKIYELSL